MGQWGGVVMLVVTGLAILLAWTWLWAGPTRRTRTIALERLYPWAPTAVLPRAQAIIWPAFPIVGAAWIAAGALSARIVLGRDPILESSLVAALFGLVLVLGVWVALGNDLPRWAYPGWRAIRFYRRRPERAEAELAGWAARRFARVRVA